jgi:hypothetical protein
VARIKIEWSDGAYSWRPATPEQRHAVVEIPWLWLLWLRFDSWVSRRSQRYLRRRDDEWHEQDNDGWGGRR